MTKSLCCMLMMAFALAAVPAYSQSGAPATDNMQILREKLKADKKLVVAVNMELTDAEAKGFWPLYDEYQRSLQKINEQLATAISAYAREYNARSLTDEKALALLKEALAVDEAEAKLRRGMVPKLAKVLPGRKVARYMQVENKIRAIVKYEIAAEVPLAP